MEPYSPTSAGSERDRATVYVVDDERMIGEVVETILEMEGYDPHFFEDPREALESFQTAEPSPVLLLTDFLMAPMNGMELIEHCKKSKPDLKTILYSGNVGEDIVQRYPFKPDAFLSKPFLPSTLLDIVKNLLDP